MDEQLIANRVANQARQLTTCHDELGRAAVARDRATVIRLSDLESTLITAMNVESTDLLRMIRQHTPAFTGEVPA
jgi:hypothetical protein